MKRRTERTRQRQREDGTHAEGPSDKAAAPRAKLARSEEPSGGLRPPLAWLILLALLTLPLFAHGCHGDDVDHEPLLIPFRLNGDD